MLSRLSMTTALLTLSLTGAACVQTDDGAMKRYGDVPRAAYAIVAEVRARPGMEDELRAATLPLVDEVRREPDNLLYFLHEDREAPGHFIFYEIFTSEAGFETHNTTPHVRAWFARLPELGAGDVKVTRMEVLGN